MIKPEIKLYDTWQDTRGHTWLVFAVDDDDTENIVVRAVRVTGGPSVVGEFSAGGSSLLRQHRALASLVSRMKHDWTYGTKHLVDLMSKDLGEKPPVIAVLDRYGEYEVWVPNVHEHDEDAWQYQENVTGNTRELSVVVAWVALPEVKKPSNEARRAKAALIVDEAVDLIHSMRDTPLAKKERVSRLQELSIQLASVKDYLEGLRESEEK